MSSHAVAWALAQRLLDPEAKLVLVLLADCADEHHTVHDVDHRRMAEDACMPARDLYDTLAILEQQRLIEREVRNNELTGTIRLIAPPIAHREQQGLPFATATA